MEQDKIWDYFQNRRDADQYFSDARQRYMLSRLEGGATVLNVGVGSGVLERLALAKAVNIHALDPNEKTIERLRQELGLGERAQVGYSQAMPFQNKTFDIVVAAEVLEHLDNTVLEESLEEVWRVLKPGGFLLASTPYREKLIDNQVVCPACAEVFHKFGHVQTFDRARMQKLLEDHAFVVEKLWITTFADWRRSGAKNFVKSLIKVFLARLGEAAADPHLLVIGRKGT